jgi:glycine/D-amino acid oxidase-like deaminating enzyme
VAVLGAGIQGCCIALELARRGHRIDLYDRCAAPVTQASYWNEGKIHLGLVYANDPTQQTYRRMLEGSVRFETLLGRWLQGPPACHATPFYYAIHKDSLLGVTEVERHFATVADAYAHLRDALQCDYFATGDEPIYIRLLPEQSAGIFAPEAIRAAYATTERAVNPVAIAMQLRGAVAATPRIEFHGSVEITGATADSAGLVIVGNRAGLPFRETYRDVVNALWSGRLAIDSSFGVRYDRPWLYRYKLGVRFHSRSGLTAVPSTTFMLGSFGDTVCYEDGSIYVSWYPDCLIGTSGAIEPPDWSARLTDAERARILRRALTAMAKLVPALQPYADDPPPAEGVGGGVIFAWGAVGIDDRGSELHRRYDIGVQSRGRYHSVDTGKYTMAPYFAIETCDRIEGAK